MDLSGMPNSKGMIPLHSDQMETEIKSVFVTAGKTTSQWLFEEGTRTQYQFSNYTPYSDNVLFQEGTEQGIFLNLEGTPREKVADKWKRILDTEKN